MFIDFNKSIQIHTFAFVRLYTLIVMRCKFVTWWVQSRHHGGASVGLASPNKAPSTPQN